MSRQSLWDALLALDEAYRLAGVEKPEPLSENSEAELAAGVEAITGFAATYEAVLWLRWMGHSDDLVLLAPHTVGFVLARAKSSFERFRAVPAFTDRPEFEPRLKGPPLFPLMEHPQGDCMLWLDREEAPLVSFSSEGVGPIVTHEVAAPTLEGWVRELAAAVLDAVGDGNRLYIVDGQFDADGWSYVYPWPGSE